MSLSPFFRSPFTDLTGNFINHQHFSNCAEIELEAMECVEAYGLVKGTRKCNDLLEDFYECTTKRKQMKRIIAMKQERAKQIKNGTLKGENMYGQTPLPESY